MPWRSRSFTIDAESSKVRSVNRAVICGAVTRRIRNAKKPTSATVTAAIAAIRAAPSDLNNSNNPCTSWPREHPHPARIACLVVTARLMRGQKGRNPPSLRLGSYSDDSPPEPANGKRRPVRQARGGAAKKQNAARLASRRQKQKRRPLGQLPAKSKNAGLLAGAVATG